VAKQREIGKLLKSLGAADLPADIRTAVDQLVNENAVLRASHAAMRERVEELEEQADRDTITPLPNRRSFLAALERTVSQAERHGTPAALLFIDLNGLRDINARHGIVAGDAALIHVAKTVLGLIRTGDLLARVGGDEFGLILDHLDHNSAIETADRIGRCIAGSPLDLGNGEISIAASIGVAGIMAGDKVEDILVRADRNLRRARDDD
jgi:diguanylate cyclase (GGDEF)-like protein